MNEMKLSVQNFCDAIPAASRLVLSLVNAYMLNDINEMKVKELSISILYILYDSFKVQESFSTIFNAKQNEEARECTKHFKEPTAVLSQPKNNWLDEVSDTGEFFPLNPIVVTNVSFSDSSRLENVAKCRKIYKSSDSHSPGIFRVQCMCSCPKLIVHSVMGECEVISTAVNILLSGFKYLPIAAYFGNGCNLSKSVLLRFPYINSETIIRSDRVHYRSHKCNIVTDLDIYTMCIDHRTSGARSIN